MCTTRRLLPNRQIRVVVLLAALSPLHGSCSIEEGDAPGAMVFDAGVGNGDASPPAPDTEPASTDIGLPEEDTDVASTDTASTDASAGHDATTHDTTPQDVAPDDAREPDASTDTAPDATIDTADSAELIVDDAAVLDASEGDTTLADADDDAKVDVEVDVEVDATDAGSGELYDPLFVPIGAGALSLHDVVTPEVPVNGFGYGYGVAPLDADGDGDLDLFVGTIPRSTVAACVYENVSTPGNVVFSQRESWCFPRPDGLVSGLGLDTDGDGAHELVAQSQDETILIRFTPSLTISAPVPEPSACTLGPMVSVDVNWDGVDEVVVSCAPDLTRPGGLNFGVARVLSVGPAGLSELRRVRLGIEENTIGLGIVDLGGDGLLDIVTVNDTFMSPDAYNPSVPPSSIHEMLPPPETATFVRRASAEGALAYGSHMGYELVGRPGHPDIHFFSDRGRVIPRVFEGGRFFPPSSWRLPTEPFVIDGAGEDSWGVLHSDWNGDGHPDLFVSFGRASVDSNAGEPAPVDTVFLSNPETGVLEYNPFAHPMPLPEWNPDSVYGLPRSSRGAIRADFDGDRREDWVVTAANGAPRVITVFLTAPRCSIIPVPSVVPTAGGYRVIGLDGTSLPGPAHGENLSHDGDRILTHVLEGTLQFPSGARVPYDCGTAATVEVVEPDWIEVVAIEGAIEVRIDSSVWGGPVPTVVRAGVAFVAGGQAVVDARPVGERWVLDVAPEGVDRVLVQIGDRWVARWLSP